MEGTYAQPDKDFENQCGEYGDLIVESAKKRISGHEWGCDVTKLTDVGPGAIKLNMTCDDNNLAVSIEAPEETRFKEILILKKIDQTKISVRKTFNGKFKGSSWPATYCSQDAQRMYRENTAKDEAEAARKADEEQLSRNYHRGDGPPSTTNTKK
jgi:hypothetical protein